MKKQRDRLTQKGLFERLIRLEAKLDLMDQKNVKTSDKFTIFALLVIFIEAANFMWNWLLYVQK